MAKVKGEPRRVYTPEFMGEAIRLAASVGGHEAARRLGMPVGTLANWVRNDKSGDGAVSSGEVMGPQPLRRPVSELEAECSRLRKELADARMDVEILRKATAYFAKGSR